MPLSIFCEGGNAGNQSMTIIVRSLALGQIDLKDFWAVFRHELGVDSLLGKSHCPSQRGTGTPTTVQKLLIK